MYEAIITTKNKTKFVMINLLNRWKWMFEPHVKDSVGKSAKDFRELHKVDDHRRQRTSESGDELPPATLYQSIKHILLGSLLPEPLYPQKQSRNN